VPGLQQEVATEIALLEVEAEQLAEERQATVLCRAAHRCVNGYAPAIVWRIDFPHIPQNPSSAMISGNVGN